MSSIVPFTDNYRDVSNEHGFQFEFYCERCGNGHKSPFYPNAVGIGASVVRAASWVFRSRLGGAYHGTRELSQLSNSAGKDKALRKGVESVSEQFRQCHGCGNWACGNVCWNPDTGQCVSCTPKLHQTITTAQGQAQSRQVREHIHEQNWMPDVDLSQQAMASCPQCSAATGGGQFCGECGYSLVVQRFCTECGCEAGANDRFCQQCGTQV